MASKERRHFSEEFKKETVALIQSSGKSLATIGRELGVNDQNLSRWMQVYGQKTVEGSEKVPSLAEFKALQAQLRHVTEERDILKKALSVFSRHESVPKLLLYGRPLEFLYIG